MSARPQQEHVQAATPINIAIDSVTVPNLGDRPQFMLRVDATQGRINEFARWAEPLKSQITHVLATDLAQSVPGALVSGNTQSAGDAPTYYVSVDVQSLESAPSDTWTMRPPKPGAAMSGRSIVRGPASGPGYDALVNAHSRALANVSGDIAGAIRSTLRP